MPRRSRFIEPAKAWLSKHAGGKPMSTKAFWEGFCRDHPELTEATEKRKTPKATCMRDLRYNDAFEVGGGRISLKS